MPPVKIGLKTGVLLLHQQTEKSNTHRQVLILGSLDYETNVFPLHHGASEPFYIMLGIKALIGIEPM